MNSESVFTMNKNFLIVFDFDLEFNDELEYVMNNFCGIVINSDTFINNLSNDTINNLSDDSLLYLCGNINNNLPELKNKTFVIKDFSQNYEFLKSFTLIKIGEVPININNVGVYFRNFFFDDKNYFELINNSHNFQSLTESNKSNLALRTGIYLTNVEKINDEIKFKLLRCSTNLNGPTCNFKDTDIEIIEKVNNISKHFFSNKTEFNHVLAQIYENDKKTNKKAKIKEHSDKTKDMPRNGLMAFCTFYNNDLNNKYVKKSHDDPYDYCYKETSALTKMRFKLKPMVKNELFIKQFDITLYPNSLFIMNLTMNRLYTHEIIPSILPLEFLPTRLGYVIRCSKTCAVYKNNKTHVIENDDLIELVKPTDEGFAKLKTFYFKENTSDEIINYDKFYFSLNGGDYMEPIL